ncbi:hypothetical protein pgond44_14508 [Psychroflexus gondwanensis ACAM 44]|jgi:hypothetical protein|uniref:Uncharacterized protein n=1 Tax=Psychroflexus gondwanensis ACAM 44 TaxID=1189619 RepID=N1WRQ6_9FLAO|nr:hypothetical protein pgond44_14508 [Psychroflexus gondwanensis ACAM 44]
MCESVSLVDHKSNVLNRYIAYTEELNRGYGDEVEHLKKHYEIKILISYNINI